MSGIQSNVTRHLKRQENTTHKEGKNKSIETNSEMTEMIELVVKDINRVTITLFHMVNKLEERLNMLRET